MNLVIYEDDLACNFTPIALTRPVFELLCGQCSVRERLIRQLTPSRWGALIRTHLEGLYREQHPDADVNSLSSFSDENTLFVNGRFLGTAKQLSEVGADAVGVNENTVVAFWANGSDLTNSDTDNIGDYANKLAATHKKIPLDGVLLEYPWDAISANGQQITQDFDLWGSSDDSTDVPEEVAILGDNEKVRIASSAHLEPYVVLDARNGPITIAEYAVIQAFTRIEGPSFIGAETQLFRANIREGTSIGPVSRIGGEVEASIIHGYSNSYHDGFLGHSYVGPWVNMGALTTNSDLKNDYSSVRIAVNGTMVDSGETKIGCLIGDHTKTAIGTLFNTGTSVGVMSMILPAGELQPKHIPSFTRLWHGDMETIQDLNASLETASIAMGRRGLQFSDVESAMYRGLFESTESDRQSAIEYQTSKKSR